MERTIDVDKLEKKVWMRYWNDGLWDLYLGLLLFWMAFSTLLWWDSETLFEPRRLAWLAVYLAAVFGSVGLFTIAKRLITRPRIGIVRFGEKAKARKRKTVILYSISVLFLSATFVASLLLWSGQATTSMPVDLLFPAVYAANMLVVFGLAAYFLEFPRLYVIAVLYAIPIPAFVMIRKVFSVNLAFASFAVPAAVILLMGAVVLVRFLRKYPVQEGHSS